MDKLLLGVFLVTYSSKGNYIPFRYPLSIYDSEISLKSKDGPNPQNQQNPQEEPQQEPQQQQLTQKANEQKERTNGVHLDTKGIDSKDNIVLIKESDEHLQTNELSPKVVEDVDRQQGRFFVSASL
ncbi:hypothetical protein AX774_g4211 [Zancudomyces culisetae]|uniref:Uncharacterized protein n=1 Tax=Zancudomyces culisetae TaxID=1213189 RepID=A0A1R1PN01_ZANCU|nr:hypothetical protein AX774_g4211 [Zancudomyces culisetae]|eukprot:OMH82311.1 hypothetical protein AX774_g4211 [Zancudomyces culisetae]